MKNNSHLYILHAVGWAFLYILPYLFSYEGLPNVYTMFQHPGDYIHLVSFLFLIAFSYANYWQFVPRFYFKKKYISYLVILIFCFFFVINLPNYIVPKHSTPGKFERTGPPRGRDRNHIEPSPLLFGKNYTILLFIISGFVSVYLHTRRHLLKIEQDKLNAEISLLKAQINPHFLFNTLNSIYALVINKDDKAAEAIVQLSEVMRYTLKDTTDSLVDLDKEINYIKNYIALQQARVGDTARIEYQMMGDPVNKKIAPLLLITFIENAFKHGINPNEHSKIVIDIIVDGKNLKLFVMNRQVASVNAQSGIGLKNVKELLQLLYPSRHSLVISNNNEIFTVELVINL